MKSNIEVLTHLLSDQIGYTGIILLNMEMQMIVMI